MFNPTITVMRTTSSIQFYCRNCKTDKQGFSPIEISLTINQKRTFIHLPRKERPADFLKETSKKKSEINDYLDTVRVKINQVQTELMQRGLAVTAERIKEYMKSGGVKTYTVNDMYNEYMKTFGEGMTHTTAGKYKLVMGEFIRFIGNGETEINSITPSVISRFYQQQQQQYKDSTSGSKMTKLKTMFKFAWENGKINHLPFSTIRINKGQPKKEYLAESDVVRLKEKTITIPRLQQVKDLFIFQMSTGLSYADIETITTLYEKDGITYIKGQRTKTKIPYTAVVLQDGIEIWNRYNGSLPILSNQKYNAYLKEIQDICGITHNLTTHLARKTYATKMLNAGIAITTVSKMLGHSNCNITQKHYASVYDDTVISEFKKVI